MEYYCIIYKPYNVLCQFSRHEGKQTLKDFFDVPTDVYPVGRLDYDSEGLMILSNDKKLNNKLLNPLHEHVREYWVQVDGIITEEAIRSLQTGVDITVDGKIYHTKKCNATVLAAPPFVPERNPPIRFRKNIPTSWISLSLKEGQNRQVRKMTAAIGFPTLRLIRYRISNICIDAMKPGGLELLSKNKLHHLLFD